MALFVAVLLLQLLRNVESSDVPVKVCANTITTNLSSLLKESNSINPLLDSIDKTASSVERLAPFEDSHYPRPTLMTHGSLQAISLHKVRLHPHSVHGVAQSTNLDYLLMLDVDRLVFGFRNASGVPQPSGASPYGGWEAPDKELRGHFVGHYLSATSMMWASTHNEQIKKNMESVVDALDECQRKIGTGYLSAFPDSFFDRYEAIHIVWAPYYTVHKIMAGLLDQYNNAGNEKALKMVTWMAEYFADRVESYVNKYTVEAQFQSLNQEVGGMNDVLYNLYRVTGNPRHLETAHKFDKPCFLGLLAIQEDSLSGFHANTHIPLVIGSQSRYEVTGDTIYKDLSEFFLKSVVDSHLYATGGTSVKEFWVDPNRLGASLDKDTEETCATYNMLKVARNLFRWTKKIEYAEYYDHALTNGILPVLRKHEPGITLYMLPLAPGISKNESSQHWGTQFDSFWCCYGTAIESFSKLGDSIYFEGSENDDEHNTGSLYIIQFVSSNMTWDSTGLVLQQTVVKPITVDEPNMVVEIQLFQDQNAKPTKERMVELNVRIPSWAAPSSKAEFNKRSRPISPGSYLTIKRYFKHGDKLKLTLPTYLRLEHIQDDRKQYSAVNAVLFGPYLLAGLSTGDWQTGTVDISDPSQWIKPVLQSNNNDLYSFSQETKSLPSGSKEFTLGHLNGSVVTDNRETEGMDWRFQSTFRVVVRGPAPSSLSLIDRTISFELMDQPSRFLSHNGVDQQVGTTSKSNSSSTRFKVLTGLSSINSVSFEAEDFPGCFLSATDIPPARPVLLKCKPVVPNDVFNTAASFKVNNKPSVAQYHPISFIASGPKRSYLLFPLADYINEHYTVYFNMR